MARSMLAVGVILLMACGQTRDEAIDLDAPGARGRVSQNIEEGSAAFTVPVQLRNGGSCRLDYVVDASTSDGAAWLSAPANGYVAAHGTAQVLVRLDPHLLAPGTYTGTLTVNGTCNANGRPARGSPVTIAVNLTVVRAEAGLKTDHAGGIAQDVYQLQNQWAPMASDSPAGGTDEFSLVWTGSVALAWGGTTAGVQQGSGAGYDPVADAWMTIPMQGAPGSRSNHRAVMSGGKMYVWGGVKTNGDQQIYFGDGASYDPVTSTWAPMASQGAPLRRANHCMAAAGTKIFVFGGNSSAGFQGVLDDGAVYSPGADSWTALPSTGAPSARAFASCVSTGSQVIVWGGLGNYEFADGAVYTLSSGTWRPMSGVNAPSPRYRHTAVWTGSKMVVWGGGVASEERGDGAMYDPSTDTWTTISPAGQPDARRNHSAVWTGSRMVVWGGSTSVPESTMLRGDGAIFDPETNAWEGNVRQLGGPEGRSFHQAVWTGTGMLVTGGEFNGVREPGALLY